MRHETAILDKKPNPKIPVIIFWGSFFSVNNKTTQKSAETHICSVVANLKREFSKKKLKTEKFEKSNFAPFFWKKRLF